MLRLYVTFLLISLSLQTCNVHNDCYSCASDKTWSGLNCRWCEKTRTCHAQGSLLNNCTLLESITKPVLCTCTHQPGPGIDTSACAWYTSGSPSPPQDPSQWGGSDFLPHPYVQAATCACSGGSSVWLWNTPTANCVRRMVLQGHQALPSELKWIVRNITVTGEYMKLTPYVPTFIDIHIKAYQTCGCPGSAAGYMAWESVMVLGNIPSCDLIIKGILATGRCGCGW
jgi:hypothetical protein